VRQLLTESCVLSLVGGLLGLLLAVWEIDALVSLNVNLPRSDEISIDGRVLVFTLVIASLTGLIFGLAPAMQASKPDLNESLKEGSKGISGGFNRHRIRSFLVVSEVALALVLLIGAGLLLKSFLHLRQVDLGFNPDRVMTFDLTLPVGKYGDARQQAMFYQQVLDRIHALPGVVSAAATSSIPLIPGQYLLFHIEGRPARGPEDYIAAYYNVAGPGYLRTMEIPLLRGRDLTDRDHDGAEKVVMISQELARRFFPNEDPIGKRLKLDPSPESPAPWLKIIGIVGDIKHSGLEAKERDAIMYVMYQQSPQPYSAFIVRTQRRVDLAAALRQAVQAIDKDQPIANLRTMGQVLAENYSQRWFNMLLLGIFAAVALMLAAIGIYGVMSYMVAQRRHEIGIRIALGAQGGDVLRLVIREGMALALIGVGMGLAASFALTRLMEIESLLYDVSTHDPYIFAMIAVLLSLVAFLACWIPAQRAMKVDPMVALRFE